MLPDDLLGDGQAQARAAGLPGAGLVHPVKALEDALAVLRGMPMPLSVTSSHTRSGSNPADMTMRPPSGVYLMALERMFIMTCKTRSRSARTVGRPCSPSRIRVWSWRWASMRMAW